MTFILIRTVGLDITIDTIQTKVHTKELVEKFYDTNEMF